MSKIEQPVCRYCGSNHFAIDATATWNADTQDWELVSTYDEGICRDCGEEGRPHWEEIK